MRENLRARAEDLREQGRLGVEVGDQQLDTATGNGLMDLGAGLPVEPGSAVGQVVARDPGDCGVAQAHRGDRLGDPARLIGVERAWLASGDLAEVTPPGALVAADPSRLTSCRSSVYWGPVRSLVLIHGGLRSIGVWLLRASIRSSRRSPGASPTSISLCRQGRSAVHSVGS